jgi:hypothetical protein
MSPTEHDLRNALHHGEGDGLDVDQLVAGGQARRRQRRVRIGSSVAAVAFVAVAATGGAVLLGHDDHKGGDTVARADRRAASQDASKQAGSAGGAAAPAPNAGGALHCPSSFPRQMLPGGGSPGQFGSGGKLFAQPVRTIVVCAYGTKQQAVDTTPPPNPGLLVFNGARARQLVASLEAAPTARLRACPTLRAVSVREFALIGVTTQGGTLRTVTVSLADPACQSMITNGTALRYAWAPPPGLAAVLDQLRPSR